MALQLLISALNKDPAELIAKMNIQTDAVLVNQCDEDVCREIPYRENTVLVLSKKERGVGRSRNLCMEKAMTMDTRKKYSRLLKKTMLQT